MNNDSLIDYFKKEFMNNGYHPYGTEMTDAVDSLELAIVAMGDANAPRSEGIPEKAEPSPAPSSEISGNGDGLKWQYPTDWSCETTDGSYYLEQDSSKKFWTAYTKNKCLGRAESLEGAKALCQAPKPVMSVDVDAGAKAIFTKRNGNWDYNKWRSDPRIAEAYRKDAESVAEAWGLNVN